MLLQPVDALLIDSNPFENAIPVKEPMIEDRYLRLVFVNEFAIYKNLHSAYNWEFPSNLKSKF